MTNKLLMTSALVASMSGAAWAEGLEAFQLLILLLI